MAKSAHSHDAMMVTVPIAKSMPEGEGWRPVLLRIYCQACPNQGYPHHVHVGAGNYPTTHDGQHNNTSARRPIHRRVAFPAAMSCCVRQLVLLCRATRGIATGEALCPFFWAVHDQLSAAICGYATITDWTASAPISRHSGYRHHHREHGQSRKINLFIASLFQGSKL